MTYERLRLCPPDLTPRGQSREIMDLIAAKHSLTRADLIGRDRTAAVSAARHEAMYEVKRLLPGLTIDRLAALFERERSTAWAALQAHRRTLTDHDQPDMFARAA